MDDVLQILMSWQFVIFSLGVVAITLVLKTIAEYLLVNIKIVAKESKIWRDLLLPILPVILGSCCAVLIKEYPYPEGLSTTGARFVFGLVAGLLSTFLYRIIKAILNQKFIDFISTKTTTSSEEPVVDSLTEQVNKTINDQ